MRDGMAETVAEAEAQAFTLPNLEDWRKFARLIDGYMVGQELGFHVIQWGGEQADRYRQTGIWDLDVLSLRLVLFWAFRTDYFTGYTYNEQDELVDSLLRALSEKTGLPYSRE